MSWLKEMSGAGGSAPYIEPEEHRKIQDPNIPDRMVSDKPANRPFLAYKAYRQKQEALHEAWAARMKERDEKITRGEKVGPVERDPTAQEEVGLLGLLKFLVYLLLFAALAGKFLTGSFTWEYESRWTQLKTYWPSQQRLFTERFLSEFDGSVPGRPIYIAIDGDVYDVTNGRAYQPGGSYAILAGVEAARAFGTGCFKTHRTHDTREMSESELRSLNHWKTFYAEHKDYKKVGRVLHEPIDPTSPVPEHCDPKKAAKYAEEAKAKAAKAAHGSNKASEHEEL